MEIKCMLEINLANYKENQSKVPLKVDGIVEDV